MSTEAALLIAVLALCLMCTVLLYCFIRAVNALAWAKEDLQDVTDTEHVKCMAAVMAFVGDEYAAQVLAVAADDYASVESDADLDRIKRLLWRQDGPPVPSIWLHERADRLRIMADAERTSTLDMP